MDLVDEMDWEDCDEVEWVSLDAAGIEEEASHPDGDSSVYTYVMWWSEDEDSRDWLTQ